VAGREPLDPTVTALPTDGKATTLRSAAPPPPPAPGQALALEPGMRLGRYELEEVIGRGGMGVVFRARDPALSRPLAIKVLNARASGARAQVRFLDEARAMAQLRHPAVLPVFDVGRLERHLYVVMPFIAGGTLHEWMSTTRRGWREVVERFAGAGAGLAAAHAAGFVHRDFKPSNVLVDDDGRVMVADFGIAAHLHDGTAPGAAAVMSTVAGTPAYMAPEQARGEAIDARADQYSFCVSLWEGLHGERPHQATTHSIVGRFVRGALTPRRHHEVPAWLHDALLRGLSAHPADRWPSMAALLEHVAERLAAPPVPTPSRATRRRGRWVAAGVASVVVAAAVVGFVATRGDARRTAPAVDVVESFAAPASPRAEAVVATEDAARDAAKDTAPPSAAAPTRPAATRPRRADVAVPATDVAVPATDARAELAEQDLSESRF